MFDVVRKYQTPAKIILGLIAITFVGFAANGYDNIGSAYLVKVGNQQITLNDLKNEMDRSQTPDSDDARKAILNRLIDTAYIDQGLKQMGVVVSVAQVKDAILAEPSFQENGVFSRAKYEAFLKKQFGTEEALVAALQKQFALQSFLGTLQAGSIFSDSQANQAIGLFAANHVIRMAVVNPADYIEKIKVTDEALQKFYKEHQAEYRIPEAAKIEYIELSVATLADKQAVSDEEAKKYFDANPKQYAKAEREVAHILIGFPEGADAAAKAKAKAEAEKVLSEAKANPKQFAELAKKYSQDPGSAQNGGNLGFFAQDGTMVKPFEDAAFALQVDQISPLVETQFGYHILKLVAVKDMPKFADVKDQIVTQLKQEKASKVFNTQVDKLTESVFLNSKELNTTAKELGLDVKVMEAGAVDGWVSKENATQIGLPEKLITTIFSNEVIKNKHNSEPVDLGNQTVMVVRAKETRPERAISFAEAKSNVEKAFIKEESLRLAREDSKAILAKLKKGETVSNLDWQKEPMLLNAQNASSFMSSDIYKEIISSRVSKDKPGFVVMQNPTAPPVIVKIEETQVPEQSKELITAVRRQLQQGQANNLMYGFIQMLKQSMKQKTGQERLTGSDS